MEYTEGITALHHAIETNQIDSIKQLFFHPDVDVNATDKYGRSASRLAIEYCRPECIEALLTHKDINIDIKDEQDITPLQIAKLLPDTTSNEKYSQYKRKFEHNIELLQSFASLEHQFQSNSTTLTSLAKTDFIGYAEYSQMTLIPKIVDNEDSEALNYILNNNLISANARDADGFTPLDYTARSDDTERFQLLLAQKDIIVNAQNNVEFTPLHYAAYNNKIESSKLLLAHPDN